MAERQRLEDLLAYYEALRTHLRDHDQQGSVLEFAQQWRDTHAADSDQANPGVLDTLEVLQERAKSLEQQTTQQEHQQHQEQERGY